MVITMAFHFGLNLIQGIIRHMYGTQLGFPALHHLQSQGSEGRPGNAMEWELRNQGKAQRCQWMQYSHKRAKPYAQGWSPVVKKLSQCFQTPRRSGTPALISALHLLLSCSSRVFSFACAPAWMPYQHGAKLQAIQLLGQRPWDRTPSQPVRPGHCKYS